MNPVLVKLTLIPPLGGDIVAPEIGVQSGLPAANMAMSGTDFAAHLLAHKQELEPEALSEPPKAPELAGEKVENANAASKELKRSAPEERRLLPVPLEPTPLFVAPQSPRDRSQETLGENGKILPPDRAARLQIAAASPAAAAHSAHSTHSTRSVHAALASGAEGVPSSAVKIPVPNGLETADASGLEFDLESGPELGRRAQRETEESVQTAPIPLAISELKSQPRTAPVVAPNVSRVDRVLPTSSHTVSQTDEGVSEKPVERGFEPLTQNASGASSAPGLSASSANTPSNPPGTIPAISVSPVNAISAPPSASASSQPLTVALDQIVDQIAEVREAGRALRPEISVRTNDFGTVAMRLEANSSDWRATLSARDPGFVPAVQAALAERAVAASGESGLNQHNPSQRGSDPQPHSGSQSSGGFGGAHSGSEPRYGSSTGSGQGSAQPYSGEEGVGGSESAAMDQGVADPSTAKAAVDGARFA